MSVYILAQVCYNGYNEREQTQERKRERKMTAYKIAFVKKYLSKWIVGLKENETADNTRWLVEEFKTKKEALSKFKCIFAPLGTKEVVKVKTLTEYEVYEAR
jgi:hypothetical protein